jgi:CHAD domain-containing protein
MAFSLTSKSALAESLALVTTSEIEALVREGERAAQRANEPTVDEVVHETRKTIKRLRALLRLYGGALDHALLTREDARLRELGHSLGAARDSAVLLESLEALLQSAPRDDRVRLADAMPVLTGALAGGSESRVDQTLGALHAVYDALGAFAQRVPSFRVGRSGWSAIAPGFRRVYAQGRRALEEALRRPSEKRLHAFRIRVKRHQHHLALLEPLWPEPIKALRHEVQRLGESLGQDHDLFMLEQRLAALRNRPELAELELPFQRAAAARHEAFRREAFELGARVYAESPRRLAERFREYFDAWS